MICTWPGSLLSDSIKISGARGQFFCCVNSLCAEYTTGLVLTFITQKVKPEATPFKISPLLEGQKIGQPHLARTTSLEESGPEIPFQAQFDCS